ncbi:MAG: hypothetical protein IJA48_00295 [Oscillospiraceae bacterium]|nr:hypothetical protein [Oscillospiraceae bacterium]
MKTLLKNKFFIFIISLLIAVGLWVYVVTVVNPEDTKTITNIPVSFANLTVLEGKGLMLTGGEKQYISLELSGKRSDLKQLSSSNVEAVADLSRIDSAGSYEITWSLDLPSTVASGDVGIVSSSSNKAKVKVSEYVKDMQLPVRVEHVGTLPDGYILDQAVLSSDTILVSGPAEELEQLKEAVITVELDQLTATIDREVEYRLVDVEGLSPQTSDYVTLSQSSLHLYIPVLHYKEIKLEVKLVEGGGVRVNDAKVSLDPPIIAVTGSEEALKDLDSLTILEIDLAKASNDDEWTVVPELPAGVSFRGTEPSVRVGVKFTGIMMKHFTIACSEIQRLDDNETLAFGEQKVSIKVRGKLTDLSGLTAQDILVTADLEKDYDPTTKTVTLTILLPEGLQAAVMNGPYAVQVIEVEPEETT